MLVILGESASGKSTLQKLFVERDKRWYKIVTYTTRPMRKGEVDGEDYHFTEDKIFEELKKKDFFIETSEYRGWSYGIAKKDCIDTYGVAVLTPSGLRHIKAEGIDTISVYLKVDRPSRLIQSVCRGDDVDEAYRRNLSDVGQFDGIEDEVDYVIENPKYKMDEEDTWRVFCEIVKRATNG